MILYSEVYLGLMVECSDKTLENFMHGMIIGISENCLKEVF